MKIIYILCFTISILLFKPIWAQIKDNPIEHRISFDVLGSFFDKDYVIGSTKFNSQSYIKPAFTYTAKVDKYLFGLSFSSGAIVKENFTLKNLSVLDINSPTFNQIEINGYKEISNIAKMSQINLFFGKNWYSKNRFSVVTGIGPSFQFKYRMYQQSIGYEFEGDFEYLNGSKDYYYKYDDIFNYGFNLTSNIFYSLSNKFDIQTGLFFGSYTCNTCSGFSKDILLSSGVSYKL